MRTDDLILRLAADPRPGLSVARGVGLRLAPALAAALVLLVLGWGLRSGLLPSLGDPVTMLKPLLPAIMAAASVAAAVRLARPDGRPGPAVAILAAVAAVALGLVALAILQTPAGERMDALRGRTLVACLLSIPALAILPTLALLAALRRGATLKPGWSGALAGLGGGAAAAALYALHCNEDSPLFFVTWYGVAILATAVAGAALGRRLLRW